MPGKKSSIGPLQIAVQILSGIGGWTFSQYCGLSIWIPGGVCLLLLLLFSKTAFRPKFFVGAIAATGGHLVWFLVATVISGSWTATGLDLVVLLIGIVWLWLRPGLSSVLFLGIFQLLALIVNGVSLSAASFGSEAHRALTTHVLFRLIALVCLAVGYWHLKKSPNQSPTPPGLPPGDEPAPSKVP